MTSALRLREPASAITHFIAMLLAIVGLVPAIMKALTNLNTTGVWAVTIFMCSMILLYASSATYHGINLGGKVLEYFKKHFLPETIKNSCHYIALMTTINCYAYASLPFGSGIQEII